MGPVATMSVVLMALLLSLAVFLNLGRLAAPNITASLASIVSAPLVVGAVLLLLELDRPFAGLIWVSGAPILSALNQPGK